MRRTRQGLRVSCPSILGSLGAAAIFASTSCADTMVPAPVAGESLDASAVGFPAPDDAASGPPVTVMTSGDCGFGCPPQTPGKSCPPGSPLSCFVNTNCPGGGATTVTGTVYDPAGRNPLPNVVVYVPEDPGTIPPFPTGTPTCACNAAMPVHYVTAAQTDSTGRFTLTGVPTGKNVPLAIEAGRWRRLIALPNVSDCGTTQLPSSGSGQARLPRNRMEGDIPRMAILTGGCDNVACFLQRVGVSPSEFSAPGAGGRVDVYQGLGATGPAAALSSGVAGDCTTSACPLWKSRSALEAYDEVFLGCECGDHDETKPASSLVAMHDWLDEGGQVFATHAQATWFKNGLSDVQSIAIWSSGPASGATGPFAVDTTSSAPNLENWLAGLGAVDGGRDVPLDPAVVSTSVTTVPPSTHAWIHDVGAGDDGGGPSGNVKLLTAGTPVSAPEAGPGLACGRIVFSDIHPGGGLALEQASSDGSGAPAAVPGACDSSPLTTGEEALEYLLFDSRSECPPTINGLTK